MPGNNATPAPPSIKGKAKKKGGTQQRDLICVEGASPGGCNGAQPPLAVSLASSAQLWWAGLLRLRAQL
eukprot:1158087-Pelagomonas_calceolata.AAC.1